MHPLAVRAAATLLCAISALSQAGAQGSDAGPPCRQGVLALMLMIDAEEHDRSHYRSTAAAVVEACGPPATAKAPASPAPFDKAACGRLALTMLEGIEAAKMASPEFAAARDAFAARCRGG